MKNELKLMGYYINVTRKDQVVQIKDLQRSKVWYEVIRQHDSNLSSKFGKLPEASQHNAR